MYEEIIIAGFGGQGILFAGKVLAHAGMKEGKYVTYMPSYGAEVRGGTAFCHIVMSDHEIATPVVVLPSTALILNSLSKEKFENKVKPGGTIILNISLAGDNRKRKDIDYHGVEATEIAYKLGNIKIANMVMLGAYSGKKKIVGIDSLILSLKEIFGPAKKKLIEINEKALREGWLKSNG